MVKDGDVIETHKVGPGIFSVGRVPENKLHLEHGSISRRHAALAFDETGDLFLVDMGSSHGTTLNDQPLRLVSFYVREVTESVTHPFNHTRAQANASSPVPPFNLLGVITG